jgi:hypothetical protein
MIRHVHLLLCIDSILITPGYEDCPKGVKDWLLFQPCPGENNSECCTDENLNGSMPEELTEVSFTDGVSLEEFVDDLVEDAGLNPSGAANAGSIIHDHGSQDHRQREEARRHAIMDGDGCGERADGCRV